MEETKPNLHFRAFPYLGPFPFRSPPADPPAMEEAKAAAYYDELTRKGEGAARFKQGLGFSSSTSSSPFPARPSSFFSNFVRASSPGKADKQAQLESIQAKLGRTHCSPSPGRRSPELRREKDDRTRRRSSSRERRKERDRERKSHSTERRRRSRSYSDEEDERSRNGRRERSRRRGSRSRSPSWVSRGRDRSRDHRMEKRSLPHRSSKDMSYKVDYARFIEGYSQMMPAERLKAKMKLQLSQTAAKDSNMGMSSGWERFDFNKDAPLDDDDNEIEVAEDDASLVKDIGRSFRFSAVQAKRDEEIKAAHDEAMFGASAVAPTFPESESIKGADTEVANNEKQDNKILISDKVLEMQQGSWRHRAWRCKS